jgi:hypothetical protein
MAEDLGLLLASAAVGSFGLRISNQPEAARASRATATTQRFDCRKYLVPFNNMFSSDSISIPLMELKRAENPGFTRKSEPCKELAQRKKADNLTFAPQGSHAFRGMP